MKEKQGRRWSWISKPKLKRDGELRVSFIGGRGVISKYSGIEGCYEEIGKRLAEHGHEVSVYCRSYFAPPVKEHNGMKVIRIPAPQRKHLETLIHTLLSTLHALLLRRYDVVHFHALGPSLFSFIPRIFGAKTVVTVHGLDWQRAKWGRFARWFLKLCEQASVKFPNATIVVSRSLREYYLERYRLETTFIPNGVNLPIHRKVDKIQQWGLESGKYILFLGRLSPEKNIHLLIQAFEKLETDVKLVIAGGTSYTSSYIKELRTHESSQIRFLGWVSGEALEELLSNAIMFVLPSDVEGLSLSLLEAMAYGLCALTSDIPANVELVQGVGHTFAHGNAEDLRRMLQLLLERKDMREEASHRARARVEADYLWTNVAKEVESLYYDVMDVDGVESGGKRQQGLNSTKSCVAPGSNPSPIMPALRTTWYRNWRRGT